VPYVTARYSNLSRSQPNATEHPLPRSCGCRDGASPANEMWSGEERS
jgi:hypothetical protein